VEPGANSPEDGTRESGPEQWSLDIILPSYTNMYQRWIEDKGEAHRPLGLAPVFGKELKWSIEAPHKPEQIRCSSRPPSQPIAGLPPS